MELTEQHRQQYWDEGYTFVPNLIPGTDMAALRARVLEIVEGKHTWPPRHFQVLDPSRYKNPDGSPIPVGIQRPGKVEKVFETVAYHSHLEAAMSHLLRGPVELFTDQVGVKHACIREEQAGKTFYHQDSYYWKIDPKLGCNCWIPCDEVGRGAIALGILPRSHQGWVITPHESYYDDPPYFGAGSSKPFMRHRVPLNLVDFSKEVVVPMKPGDALFFTNYTWHRSEENRSGATKVFYAIAYKRTMKS
ncbi:MAG: phytanoyl-CoA dioxygenase family protein [Planctomycetes bacterium]|nr:phytanoyl-CoA dioxygenase family protein [Planctomycetota bacterium]